MAFRVTFSSPIRLEDDWNPAASTRGPQCSNSSTRPDSSNDKERDSASCQGSGRGDGRKRKRRRRKRRGRGGRSQTNMEHTNESDEEDPGCDSSEGASDVTSQCHDDRRLLSQNLSVNNETTVTIPDLDPDEWMEVFGLLLREFNGRTKLGTLMSRKGNLLRGFSYCQAAAWFKKSNRFRLFEKKGQVKWVSIYFKEARSCVKYGDHNTDTCHSDTCPFFHVCRDFISGTCPIKSSCGLSHSFLDQSNAVVCADAALQDFTNDEIRTITFRSAPVVCDQFNRGACNDDCPDLHVCARFIRNNCSDENCKFGHRVKQTDHNKWVLNTFHMQLFNENTLKKLVITLRNESADDDGEDKPHLSPSCSNDKGLASKSCQDKVLPLDTPRTTERLSKTPEMAISAVPKKEVNNISVEKKHEGDTRADMKYGSDMKTGYSQNLLGACGGTGLSFDQHNMKHPASSTKGTLTSQKSTSGAEGPPKERMTSTCISGSLTNQTSTTGMGKNLREQKHVTGTGSTLKEQKTAIGTERNLINQKPTTGKTSQKEVKPGTDTQESLTEQKSGIGTRRSLNEPKTSADTQGSLEEQKVTTGTAEDMKEIKLANGTAGILNERLPETGIAESMKEQKTVVATKEILNVQKLTTESLKERKLTIGTERSGKMQTSTIGTEGNEKVQASTIGRERSEEVQTSTIGTEGSMKVQTSTIGTEGSMKVQTSTIGTEGRMKVQTSTIGTEGRMKVQTSTIGTEGRVKMQTSTIGTEGSVKVQTSTIGTKGSVKVQTSTIGTERSMKVQTSTTGTEGSVKVQTSTIGTEGSMKVQTSTIGREQNSTDQKPTIGTQGSMKPPKLRTGIDESLKEQKLIGTEANLKDQKTVAAVKGNMKVHKPSTGTDESLKDRKLTMNTEVILKVPITTDFIRESMKEQMPTRGSVTEPTFTISTSRSLKEEKPTYQKPIVAEKSMKVQKQIAGTDDSLKYRKPATGTEEDINVQISAIATAGSMKEQKSTIGSVGRKKVKTSTTGAERSMKVQKRTTGTNESLTHRKPATSKGENLKVQIPTFSTDGSMKEQQSAIGTLMEEQQSAVGTLMEEQLSAFGTLINLKEHNPTNQKPTSSTEETMKVQKFSSGIDESLKERKPSNGAVASSKEQAPTIGAMVNTKVQTPIVGIEGSMKEKKITTGRDERQKSQIPTTGTGRSLKEHIPSDAIGVSLEEHRYVAREGQSVHIPTHGTGGNQGQRPAMAVGESLQEQRPAVAVGRSLQNQRPASAEGESLQEQRHAMAAGGILQEQRPAVAVRRSLQEQRPAVAAGGSLNEQRPAVAVRRSLQEQRPAVAVRRSLQEQRPAVAAGGILQEQRPAVAVRRSLQEQRPAVAAGGSLNEQRPAVAVRRSLQEQRPAVAAGGSLNEQRPAVAVGGSLKEQRPAMTIGGSLKEQRPAVAAGGILQEQRPAVAVGGSVKEQGPVVAVGGSLKEQRPAVAVGGSLKKQRPAVAVGGSLKEQRPVVAVGGSLKEQGPAAAIGGSLKERGPAAAVGGSLKEQRPAVAVGGSLEEQRPAVAVGGSLKDQRPAMTIGESLQEEKPTIGTEGNLKEQKATTTWRESPKDQKGSEHAEKSTTGNQTVSVRERQGQQQGAAGDREYEELCERYAWTGACPRGPLCSRYHHPDGQPFVWQLRVFGTWRDLSDTDSRDIEQLFAALVHKAICQVVLDGIGGLQVAIDFSSMTAVVEDICEGPTLIGCRRLSTPSYVKAEAGTPLNLYTQWVWYFESSGKQPLPFRQRSLQYTLEEKYLAGQERYYFERDDGQRNVALLTQMKLVDLQSGTTARIYRRPHLPLVDMGASVPMMTSLLLDKRPADPPCRVPDHWCIVDHHQHFELVWLQPNSAEYREISASFHSTLPPHYARIVQIFRVQNPSLWDRFCSTKRWMAPRDERGGVAGKGVAREGEKVDERVLFHGTPKLLAARGICTNNMDFRRAGQHVGARYGRGSYFSTSALFSHDYTTPPTRYMFRARVLVGKFTKGHSSFTTPPVREGLKLYDSCVNDEVNPTIFVIFDLAQSYPEHLIEYEDVQRAKSPGLAAGSAARPQDLNTARSSTLSVATSPSSVARSPPTVARSPSTSRGTSLNSSYRQNHVDSLSSGRGVSGTRSPHVQSSRQGAAGPYPAGSRSEATSSEPSSEEEAPSYRCLIS